MNLRKHIVFPIYVCIRAFRTVRTLILYIGPLGVPKVRDLLLQLFALSLVLE